MTCSRCGAVDSTCRGAFQRAGVHAVHWECWSDCNLQCDFCYRSMRPPLPTERALELIDAIAYAGAARLILAGGDPSLRNDLDMLCRRARDDSLVCEIQTNGQVITPALAASLDYVERLYLSLDGATAPAHDGFRAKKGNFAGVARLLRRAEDRGLPVTVHSVVSRRNIQEMRGICTYVSAFPCVDTWSVLQFSPSGSGFRTKLDHEVTSLEWERVVADISSVTPDHLRVVALAQEQKKALYAMISADGYAYRAADSPGSPISDQARIGPVLGTHLTDIAAGWRISPVRHLRRYR